jgi:hypothetical protein
MKLSNIDNIIKIEMILKKIALVIVAITFPLWIIPVIAIIGVHAVGKSFYNWLNDYRN